MTMAAPRQYITVGAPNAAAGLGKALRQAFNGPEMRAPVQMFERLMERLNRLD